MKLVLTAAAATIVTLALAGALPAATAPQSIPVAASLLAHGKHTHRVVIQVSENDPKVMNLALNNAENLSKYYGDLGEPIQIEIVAYGPGLAMVRTDTSPVKDRLMALASHTKGVTIDGCNNTLDNQSKQESKAISLVPEAHIVPAGIQRIVELEEQGWTYIRP